MGHTKNSWQRSSKFCFPCHLTGMARAIRINQSGMSWPCARSQNISACRSATRWCPLMMPGGKQMCDSGAHSMMSCLADTDWALNSQWFYMVSYTNPSRSTLQNYYCVHSNLLFSLGIRGTLSKLMGWQTRGLKKWEFQCTWVPVVFCGSKWHSSTTSQLLQHWAMDNRFHFWPCWLLPYGQSQFWQIMVGTRVFYVSFCIDSRWHVWGKRFHGKESHRYNVQNVIYVFVQFA